MRLKYQDIGAHQAEPYLLLLLDIIVGNVDAYALGYAMGMHFVATKWPEKGGKMPLFAP